MRAVWRLKAALLVCNRRAFHRIGMRRYPPSLQWLLIQPSEATVMAKGNHSQGKDKRKAKAAPKNAAKPAGKKAAPKR